MNGLNVLHASATVIQKLVDASLDAFVCRLLHILLAHK